MGTYKETQNSTQRYDNIVEEATKLFEEKDFEEVTMQEIAENANVGIENLYKFFATKRDLFFTVALSFWHKKYLINEDIKIDDLNGIDGVGVLIDEEVRIFMKYPKRYVFLEKFDNYIKNHLRANQIQDVKQVEFLERYENACKHDENIWKMAFLAGLSDKSIKDDLDLALTVYTMSIMKMAVFQKFANRRVVIEMDTEFETEEIITIIKKMMLKYLEA